MWEDFPGAEEVDGKKLAEDLARPEPKIRYVMMFTPRSGSSWLTDIASKSKRLGMPGECFNPEFLWEMVRAANATNMKDYIEVLARRRNTRGVFGCQLTYHQLLRVFGSEEVFLSYFAGSPFFWLIREDIILQGVSLQKMVQVKVSHSTEMTSDEIAKADAAFGYNPEAIKYWVRHILVAELGTEAMFEVFGIAPRRMSYEMNVRLGARAVLEAMAMHLGLSDATFGEIASDHKKIATKRNFEYAERFREEYPEFVAEVEEARAHILERLRQWDLSGAGGGVKEEVG